MSDAQTIGTIVTTLQTATTYTAVFGPLAGSSADEQKKSLRKSFAYLARMVHPDHAPASCAKQAAAAMTELTRTRDGALRAIERGTYATEKLAQGSASADLITFVSKTATYACRPAPLFSGDFSHIYAGTVKGGTEQVHLKIAHAPPFNTFLAREAEVHARLMKLPKVARFAPHAMDSFLAHGDKGALHRVNVTRTQSGLVSVARILAAHPRGLPPEDATWIARRVFAQVILAKMAGVVHGAILPEHVLVHPTTREPFHLGWIHAVDLGASARITHIVDRYRAWYPREVFEKKMVDERTDIAMAAAVATALYAGVPDFRKLPTSTPPRLVRFLEKCLDPSPVRRMSDARAALEEFTTITRAEWGRTYRPLVLPV